MNREQGTGNREQDTAPMRTRVKICGITNSEDAQEAIRLGADALGFIFVPESPRYVDDITLDKLARQNTMSPFVDQVLVIRAPEDGYDVDPNSFRFRQHYEEQPNYAENPSEIDDLPGWVYESWRYIRAFRLKDETSLAEIDNYPYGDGMLAYLLDTYHKDKLGGAGEAFNWDLAVEVKKRHPEKRIILAGGLTPENVGEAIAKVRPYAVDVSSGVEAEPGRKDYAKLAAFFQAVREADAMGQM